MFSWKDDGVGERSPSPRRAWIEMQSDKDKDYELTVALPTEGVD